MRTADLNAFAGYAYQRSRNATVRPVLMLDTKAWMMGVRTDGTDRVFEIARAPRQNLLPAQTPYIAEIATGLPVLSMEHGTYRWMTSDERERIVEDALTLLQRGYDKMDAENLLGSYPVGEGIGTIVDVPVTMRDGRKGEIRVGFELIRPQHLLGAWGDTLNRLKQEQAETETKVRANEAKRTAGDLLDRQVADRVDALLKDGKPRSQYNGAREDITRQRSGTHFQVSVETLLKLLALAEGAAE